MQTRALRERVDLLGGDPISGLGHDLAAARMRELRVPMGDTGSLDLALGFKAYGLCRGHSEERSAVRSDEQPGELRPSLALGAAVAAGLVGACCVLPVVLSSLGLSAMALSAFFEPVGSYLLGAGVVLLGAGGYYAYIRVASPRRARSKPFDGSVRLLVVAIVGAGLLSSCHVADQDKPAGEIEMATFIVEGMTKSRSGAT